MKKKHQIQEQVTLPCQYSIEELTKNAEMAIKEYKAGKGTPHEQIKPKNFNEKIPTY